MMNTDAFLSITADLSSRETYLEWRAAWRTVYAILSRHIRSTKLTINNGMRAGDYMGSEQATLVGLRWDANAMMEVLTATKLAARVARDQHRQAA